MGNKRAIVWDHNTTNIPPHIPRYEYTGVTLLTDIQSQKNMQLDGSSCLKEKTTFTGTVGQHSLLGVNHSILLPTRG